MDARARRFPVVDGRSLLGRTYRLPADLPGERTLAVIAFQQWHQARVDRWIARAAASGIPSTLVGVTGRLPLAVVELPVLATGWRLVRGAIDGGMAAGIGDPDILSRTITVYTSVRRFRAPLGIPDSRDVVAAVVTPGGAVLAMATGEVDEGWALIAPALAAPGSDASADEVRGAGQA